MEKLRFRDNNVHTHLIMQGVRTSEKCQWLYVVLRKCDSGATVSLLLFLTPDLEKVQNIPSIRVSFVNVPRLYNNNTITMYIQFNYARCKNIWEMSVALPCFKVVCVRWDCVITFISKLRPGKSAKYSFDPGWLCKCSSTMQGLRTAEKCQWLYLVLR